MTDDAGCATSAPASGGDESERTPEETAAGPTPEEAIDRITERAGTVRDREVETAIARLEARGDLSAAEREAVERLADRLVARLVAVPERALRAAEEGAEAAEEGAEAAETALDLFG